MDRLAEQVVDWHNRHPLAKRITIYDVHTIGVVALPFMRRGGGALGGAPVEPVLSNEVSPESLQAGWHEGTTVAAELHPNAAHLDALADHEAPPVARRSPLTLLRQLLPLLLRRRSKVLWPVFSDRFIENLSVQRTAAFADEYGYATRPGDASWPLRTIAVDDALAAQGADTGSGAWPCELYLKSAAIDAGDSRSRVLIGRGGLRPPMLGRRCLDPKRLGAAAALALLLVGLPVWRMWPHGEATNGPAHAASAPASAAIKPVQAALPASTLSPSVAESMAASAPVPAASAASAAASASAASMPETPAPAEPAASQLPDIRPQILPLRGGRTRGGKPIKDAPSIGAAYVAAEAASAAASAAPPLTPTETPAAKPGMPAPAGSSAAPMVPMQVVVVALVGPPNKDKAEAEKLLATMLELAQPTLPAPAAAASGAPRSSSLPIQSQVFLTPEGWRPAIYPFSSREQAQLVNANLVAHGLKTKAINF
jgi:hypothetical protein